MEALAVAQHEWLRQLVGEWEVEMSAAMAPGQAPTTFRGRETVRMLGDLWIVCDGECETPGGGTGLMMMTLGFDPSKERFVGTFVGSMMTHMWVYEGELDAAGAVLTLNTQGACPAATGGKLMPFRDIITLISDDQRTLTSVMSGDDGAWREVMNVTYRRR